MCLLAIFRIRLIPAGLHVSRATSNVTILGSATFENQEAENGGGNIARKIWWTLIHTGFHGIVTTSLRYLSIGAVFVCYCLRASPNPWLARMVERSNFVES